MSLNWLPESPELKRALIYKTLQVCPSLARGRDFDTAVEHLCRVGERKSPEPVETNNGGVPQSTNVSQYEEALSCLAAGLAKKHAEVQSDIARRRAALDEEERAHRAATISKLRSLLQMLAGVGQALPEASVARNCAPLLEAMRLGASELRRLLMELP